MKYTYTFFSSCLCIFCASLLLSGCSYFDTEEEGEQLRVEMHDDDPINIVVETPEDPQVFEYATQSDNGEVVIYSLDDAPAPMPHYTERASVKPESMAHFPSTEEAIMISMMAGPDAEYPEEDAGSAPVTVYFAYNSSALSAQALDKIAFIAQNFKISQRRGVTVVGHASFDDDTPESKAANFKISSERASAVVSALVKKGVPSEAIRIVARGDSVPPEELNGKTLDAAARRAEIYP